MVYVQNGCTYCHTQFVRNIDWGLGAERIAQSGDYVQDQPHLLGTERTGPDLSQEGGEHPDDWHLAHFTNPRYVRPESIMPNWEFLGIENIRALIAYKQSLGIQNGRLSGRAAKILETEIDRSLRSRTRQECGLAALIGAGALEKASESLSDDRSWPQARTSDLPGFLHRLPWPDRRWNGAGPAIPLSASFELYHPARSGHIGRNFVLSDHERHYRHRDALF